MPQESRPAEQPGRVMWWDRELRARAPQVGAPKAINGLYYFTHRDTGRVVLRRLRPGASLSEAQDVVIPDDYGPGTVLARWKPGPGDNQLTFWTSGADEVETLRVLDLAGGTVVGDPIPNCLQGSCAGQVRGTDASGRHRESLLYFPKYDDPERVTSGGLWLRRDAGLAGGADVRVPLPPSRERPPFTFITELELTEDGDHRWLTMLRWHGNGQKVQILVADLNTPGADPAAPHFRAIETTMPPRAHELNIRDGHATFASTDNGRLPNGAVFRVPLDRLHRREAWGAPLVPAAENRHKRLMRVLLAGQGGDAAMVLSYNQRGVDHLEVRSLNGAERHTLHMPDSDTGGGAFDITADESRPGPPTFYVQWADFGGPRVFEHSAATGAAAEWAPSRAVSDMRPPPTPVKQISVPFRYADGKEGISILTFRDGVRLPATTVSTAYTHYTAPQYTASPSSHQLHEAILGAGGVLHTIIAEPTPSGTGLPEAWDAVIAAQANTNARGLTDPARSVVMGVSGGASTAAEAVRRSAEFGGAVLVQGYLNWSREAHDRLRYGICQDNDHAFGPPGIAEHFSPLHALRSRGFLGPVPRMAIVASSAGDIRTAPELQSDAYAEALEARGVQVIHLKAGATTGHLRDRDPSGGADLNARIMARLERDFPFTQQGGAPATPRGVEFMKTVSMGLGPIAATGGVSAWKCDADMKPLSDTGLSASVSNSAAQTGRWNDPEGSASGRHLDRELAKSHGL